MQAPNQNHAGPGTPPPSPGEIGCAAFQGCALMIAGLIVILFGLFLLAGVKW